MPLVMVSNGNKIFYASHPTLVVQESPCQLCLSYFHLVWHSQNCEKSSCGRVQESKVCVFVITVFVVASSFPIYIVVSLFSMRANLLFYPFKSYAKWMRTRLLHEHKHKRRARTNLLSCSLWLVEIGSHALRCCKFHSTIWCHVAPRAVDMDGVQTGICNERHFVWMTKRWEGIWWSVFFVRGHFTILIWIWISSH